jgi:hypothetical protein
MENDRPKTTTAKQIFEKKTKQTASLMLKQKRKSRLIPTEPACLNAEKRDATGGKASALSPTMTRSKPSSFSAVRSFSKTS